jgi:thiosulfate/3-mercaptopyruvate sulfurtransferase
MASSPLVSTAWLEQHLGDPDLRILEVCNIRDDKAYREGHIPGALWFYWKTACWHETDRNFVTPAAMAKLFGSIGIGANTTVVLYGDPVQFGSYAYWAFTMAGHARLKLLDGGRRKWLMEKRPLTRDVPRFSAVDYPAPSAGDTAMRIGRDDVSAHLREPQRLLIDLRSPEEYSGERVSDYSFAVDHGAERTGRIPGAVHLYLKDLLNADDSFKSPEQLRGTLAAAGIAPEEFDDIVCYCRLSHRATIGWIALGDILGLNNVKIYDGSWTEWGSVVGFPIEK